mgnify:FL=1
MTGYRRWSAPLFALLLGAWAGLAAASEVHPVKHGEGRLWRIERGDTPPSHIIGTVHVTDPRVRDLPAPIREAFENSEQAAFEMRMTPEEIEAMMARLGSPERSRPLTKLLDRATFDRLAALVAPYGLDRDRLNQLHPFAVMYLLSAPPEEHQRQASGDLVLDAWLIQWAYDLGLRVEGLETLDEHFGFIDQVPLKDHATMLRETVAELEKDPDHFERLIIDYLDGDLSRFFAEMEAEARKDPGARAFKEAILDQRNHQMVERAIPLLARGKAFIAVGAAHLPGEEGMLALLERRGYTVTRVH